MLYPFVFPLFRLNRLNNFSFQEEDRDTMREMQRDLEAANKTCRILQFKLRKAERRFEQCEAERATLEERTARLEADLYSEADMSHIRSLEVGFSSILFRHRQPCD
ncbi:unnamed protein product [Protopolystoma xenopodis]|uniref:Uncharacterized protein n=1 Tax=Protopolystoma xenopodis TaxID=117903 RepID=A0A448X079_9PLAT|nr:unnamed protein product [Protopolystoma xenopodis]